MKVAFSNNAIPYNHESTPQAFKLDTKSLKISNSKHKLAEKEREVPNNLKPLFHYLNADLPKPKPSSHPKSLGLSQQNYKSLPQSPTHSHRKEKKKLITEQLRLKKTASQRQLGHLNLGKFVSLETQQKLSNNKPTIRYSANSTENKSKKVLNEQSNTKNSKVAIAFRKRKGVGVIRILGRKKQPADKLSLKPLHPLSENTSIVFEDNLASLNKPNELTLQQNLTQRSYKTLLLNKVKRQKLIEGKPKLILANELEANKAGRTKLLIRSAQASPKNKKPVNKCQVQYRKFSSISQPILKQINNPTDKRVLISKPIYARPYISLRKTVKNNSVASTPEATILSNSKAVASLNTKEDKVKLVLFSIENVKKLNYIKDREQIITYIKNYFRENGKEPETKTNFYRVGRSLGKGAFGKVNLGMHKLTGKLVAIKSINKKCFTSKESKRKVMQEYSILKNLRHPNVIRLYESFESAKHILIVTELCTGGDLANYVRKEKRLSESKAKLVTKKILEGLAHCHSRRVLHRDIKLDNVLLNADGELKICDFGVSQIIREGEKMTEQCGTLAYIAPEIIRGKGYEDFAADIWSTGVVLYAMLYGTVPFKSNDVNKLHKLIMKGKYTLKEDISKQARDLLKGILERNPCKRLTIAEILEHEWIRGESVVSLFSEEEKTILDKEYSCKRRKDPSEASNSLFTEQNIDSTFNELGKNNSTKSQMLAPFNTIESDLEKGEDYEVKNKKDIIKFSGKVRDLDRQYERNNNEEVDNGVYNKFMCENEDDNVSISSSEIQSIEDYITISKQPKVKRSESTLAFTTDQSVGIPELDMRVLDTIEFFGYPKDYVKKCLYNNELNHATTTYYLLTNHYS